MFSVTIQDQKMGQMSYYYFIQIAMSSFGGILIYRIGLMVTYTNSLTLVEFWIKVKSEPN